MQSISKEQRKALVSHYTSLYDSKEFLLQNTYDGHDLGCICYADRTEFRLWAPTASEIVLQLFLDARLPGLVKTLPMQKTEHGVWICTAAENLHGTYYTYLITENGRTVETTDPYARACCANGVRSMAVDLNLTNPEGWAEDHGPALEHFTDAILYELHVRDLSSDPSSRIKAVGKFAGLTETGTKNQKGMPTGLDHILELGVTHVHLLPCFDYSSVDESLDTPSFNWGYDPANYNIPEGSYTSNADDGSIRIREFKELVHAFHCHGLGVIMDVVYNHTSAAEDSNFNLTAPYYYYRMKEDGTFSDGSACGNETASERPMVRNFILDSLVYWAQEYHIDGFRFDLMGLHDMDTMRAVRRRLDEISPSLILYGEGWTGGPSVLPEKERTLKKSISQVPGIAVFNDNLRDALKGSVFNQKERGFATGEKNLCEEIRFSICGACCHPQVNLAQAVSADSFWAASPAQCINYVSAHDNLTLWDKIAVSCGSASKKNRLRMNLLAAAVYIMSQGIPFLQAGEEFLRSKPSESGEGFNENSYNAPDTVNSLKWNELSKKHNRLAYDYYCGLIAFREKHPALRMDSAKMLQNHLCFFRASFFGSIPENTVAYRLYGHPNKEPLAEICVLFNPNKESLRFPIPDETWNIYVQDQIASDTPIGSFTGNAVNVPAISCMVLGHF